MYVPEYTEFQDLCLVDDIYVGVDLAQDRRLGHSPGAVWTKSINQSIDEVLYDPSIDQVHWIQ